MSNSEQCYILHLNDDCFYEIYKFLPVIDYCSLHETCTRLRTIADYCFQRRSESFRLKPLNVSGSSCDLLKVKDVKRLIRIFGQFLKKLSIDRKDFEEDPSKLILLLDRYCVTLQDLELIYINLDKSTIMQCGRIFSILRRLMIDHLTDDETFDYCLTQCVSLKELEIVRFDIEGNSLERRCESLEAFTMRSSGGLNYDFDKHVKQFFIENWQLKKLKLIYPFFNAYHIMDDVCRSLPNLEELSLQYCLIFPLDIAPVTQIPLLKKLEVNLFMVSDDDVNKLLSGLALLSNMENLQLASFSIAEEPLRRICALKTLKVLKFTEAKHLNGNVCKKLAIELPALSEVHIIECEGSTLTDTKEFVVHLTNLKKIIFSRQIDSQLSITEDMILSLVDARKKKQINETLFVFLHDDDLVDIRNKLEGLGISRIFIETGNVMKLLPLDKEHITTVVEYGSRFKRPNDILDLLESSEDDTFDFDDDEDDILDFDDDGDDILDFDEGDEEV